MTNREKILTAGVAAAGVLWFGSGGVQKYRDAVERNQDAQIEAEALLSEANAALDRGMLARKRLTEWRKASLPTNREIAKSLYQDWLRDQLTAAGLTVSQLADKSGSSRNAHYGELSVDVTAAGTLAQVADFLYRFYTAPHLHRIVIASIVPENAGEKLTIALSASALMLADCPRSDSLAEGTSPEALPLPSEEFSKRLVSRNLFAPPKPTSGSDDQPDSEAAGARLTAMTSDSAGWRLAVRKGEEMLYFREGDSIQIGRFDGTVVKLEELRATFETSKGQMEVRVGQNLGEAAAIASPPASADNPAPTAEAPAA